jgi:pilus assembly protein CpaF
LHANSAREAVVKMCTLPLLAGENIGTAFVVPTVASSVDLVVASAEEVDASGLTLVVVRCSGSVPSLLAALGNLLPLDVTGRAVKEGP